MTQELMDEIERLSRKFSAKEREEGDDQTQRARHMIVGVFQAMESEQNRSELLGQLRESKGKELRDLEGIFREFFSEKTGGVQSTRQAIGRIIPKRIAINRTEE